jgi:hypothetical protein
MPMIIFSVAGATVCCCKQQMPHGSVCDRALGQETSRHVRNSWRNQHCNIAHPQNGCSRNGSSTSASSTRQGIDLTVTIRETKLLPLCIVSSSPQQLCDPGCSTPFHTLATQDAQKAECHNSCLTQAHALSYTCHILVIYLSYTCHILVIYLSYTCHILASQDAQKPEPNLR